MSDLSHDDMASMMVGGQPPRRETERAGSRGEAVLKMQGVHALDRSGLAPIEIDDLTVHGGEIVGIAGVSGNGQMELMEILAGQRPVSQGEIQVSGEGFHATREEAHRHRIRFLPEEPLRNACAPRMSVTENLAFRTFDLNGAGRRFWLDRKGMKGRAHDLIEGFQVKTASADSPIQTLSGGNVQRAVLARELTGEVNLLLVSNPCFGLDFSAVAAIRSRIVAARNAGAAVLLLSEDLDEILELSDRVLVMSEGRIVYETQAAEADIGVIGQHMAGHA